MSDTDQTATAKRTATPIPAGVLVIDDQASYITGRHAVRWGNAQVATVSPADRARMLSGEARS